jgi:hypothetical protein
MARELGDPALVIRALVAHGVFYAYDVEVARADFTEAGRLARELDDRWRLSQILASQAMAGMMVGDPAAIIAAGPEGRDLAESIGDDFNARRCRLSLGILHLYRGEMTRASALFRDLAAEAKAAHDPFTWVAALVNEVFTLAWMGDVHGAQATVDAVVEEGARLGEFIDRIVYAAIAG